MICKQQFSIRSPPRFNNSLRLQHDCVQPQPFLRPFQKSAIEPKTIAGSIGSELVDINGHMGYFRPRREALVLCSAQDQSGYFGNFPFPFHVIGFFLQMQLQRPEALHLRP
jgi:hypothetical protein